MRTSFCSALALVLLTASPARAQFAVTVMPSIIGNTVGMMAAQSAESDCMTGVPLPDSEIIEAREPATAAMHEYFRAAQSGGPKSAAFHLDAKTRWIDGMSNADMANLDDAADPLATDGRVLIAKPLRFYRSFLDAAALGQWAVQDADGATVGVYTAMLVRKGGIWKIRNLTISRAGSKVEPAMPFCHTPGDVTEFRVKSTHEYREQTEKRLAKARDRQDVALASHDQPGAEQGARRVAKLEKLLIDLRKAEEDANANARSVERLTVDASQGMTLATTS